MWKRELIRPSLDGGGRLALGISFRKKIESEPQSPAWPEALTDREREIIQLVGQGLSNKDIAYQLSISDSTVRHHLTSIFDKIGVPIDKSSWSTHFTCAPHLSRTHLKIA